MFKTQRAFLKLQARHSCNLRFHVERDFHFRRA